MTAHYLYISAVQSDICNGHVPGAIESHAGDIVDIYANTAAAFCEQFAVSYRVVEVDTIWKEIVASGAYEGDGILCAIDAPEWVKLLRDATEDVADRALHGAIAVLESLVLDEYRKTCSHSWITNPAAPKQGLFCRHCGAAKVTPPFTSTCAECSSPAGFVTDECEWLCHECYVVWLDRKREQSKREELDAERRRQADQGYNGVRADGSTW